MEIPELAQYAKLFEENRSMVELLLQAESDTVLVELGTHQCTDTHALGTIFARAKIQCWRNATR